MNHVSREDLLHDRVSTLMEEDGMEWRKRIKTNKLEHGRSSPRSSGWKWSYMRRTGEGREAGKRGWRWKRVWPPLLLLRAPKAKWKRRAAVERADQRGLSRVAREATYQLLELDTAGPPPLLLVGPYCIWIFKFGSAKLDRERFRVWVTMSRWMPE